MTTARKPAKEPKATERELLHLLERRHAKQGNGGSGEYAFLTHVRNDGGFAATRTFDAVAVALWPSRNYAIHVYEVKVSRSDWLRELKDPAKSEAAWAIGDQFSIVATAGVVDQAELPQGWGLIEAHGARHDDNDQLVGRKLRTVVPPTWHSEKNMRKATLPRGLMVAMLRAAGSVPAAMTVAEQEIHDAEARGRTAASEQWASQVNAARQELAEATELMRVFRVITGHSIDPRSTSRDQVVALAERIKELMTDERQIEANRSRLRRIRDELASSAERLDAFLEADVVGSAHG